MTKVYPAIIHKEESGFWIEFPDLKGCYTEGNTLEDLFVNAEEALGGYLAVKLEAGEELPMVSKLEDIKCTSETLSTYISTDVNKYHRDTKAVKRMISLPAWLAKEADSRKLSLSKITKEALLKKIDIA